MRRSQNYHFRPAFLGDCDAAQNTAIIDTEGYEESLWVVNIDTGGDVDGSNGPTSMNFFAISGSENADMSSSSTLYAAGATSCTDGSTSSVPQDKDMRVISVRLDPSLPGRRYQRATFGRSSSADPIPVVYALCGLRHNGSIPMSNAVCAGTNGQAYIGNIPNVKGGSL